MPVPAPRAIVPRPREVHAQGQSWTDDYAWLRAENWQDVLRDPATLPDEIRTVLEARTSIATRCSRRSPDCKSS